MKAANPPEQQIHRLGAQAVALPSRLEALLAYWLQKCGPRPMPQRADLPVSELKPWLGQLALIEIEEHGAFRIRLGGTNLIRRLGREATGARVDDLAFDIARQLRAILTAVVRDGEPIIAISHVLLGRLVESYSEVALPLAGADGALATILFASYENRRR